MITWDTIQNGILSWVRTASGFPNENVFWDGDKRPLVSSPYISMKINAVRKIGQDWTTIENNPLVIVDDVIEAVDTVTDTLTLTAHGLLTADGPVRFVTTGSLPGGISLVTDYWIIRVNNNQIKLASTFHNAYDLIAIDISSAGTGVNTLQDTVETVRYGEELKRIHQGPRDCRLTLQCFGGSPKGQTNPVAVLEAVLSDTEKDSVVNGLATAGLSVISYDSIQSDGGFIGSTLFEPRAIAQVRFFVPSEVAEYSTFIDSAELTNQVTNDVTVIVLPEE